MFYPHRPVRYKRPNKKRPERVSVMAEAAEDVIVRNLIETLERLQEDIDRMETWTDRKSHV